ncbi:hypothetical protein [Aeromicrobium sp. Leaf350]|uniref:hypothetical protein n=1 Tax=Aeromicrobium sp. Leaf350 TaxID=2876565 RepID=UPI001E5C519C|nr:hypothetical protein [Aeromicrobium sp. Leaf350]
MVIGGDPTEVREHARRVRAWADQVDGVAGEVLQADSVAWVSDAASRFRDELAARQVEVQAIAERYREAADRLDALAAALEERQQVLAGLLAAAGRTFEELAGAVSDGVGDVVDVAQGWANDLAETGRDVLDWAGL